MIATAPRPGGVARAKMVRGRDVVDVVMGGGDPIGQAEKRGRHPVFRDAGLIIAR
jgi:hypothetical protein